MASMVGDDVSLRCVGNGSMRWAKHVGGANTWYEIVTVSKVGNESRYDLNTEPEDNYELTIKSVLLSDARRYQCSTLFVHTDYANAELIVFGKTFFQFHPSPKHLRIVLMHN